MLPLAERDVVSEGIATVDGHRLAYAVAPVRMGTQTGALVRAVDLGVGATQLNATMMTFALVGLGVLLAIDLRTRRLSVEGRELDLSAREYALAETFLRNPGQVLSRERLLSTVWGYDFDPGSNIVDVYVGYLRRKIGGDVIETVRGMGYRLV